MLKNTILAAALAASAMGAFAGPLTGQTLGASGGFHAVSPTSAVVGAGAEFTEAQIAVSSIQNDLSFDFDENGLVKVTFLIAVNSVLSHTSLDLQTFSDILGTIDDIVGFDLVSVSGVTGIAQSDLSFTANSVSMSLGSGTSWNPNGFITAQMRFAAPTGVPEPQTLTLAGLALIAGAAARRRSRAA